MFRSKWSQLRGIVPDGQKFMMATSHSAHGLGHLWPSEAQRRGTGGERIMQDHMAGRRVRNTKTPCNQLKVHAYEYEPALMHHVIDAEKGSIRSFSKC